MQEREGRLVFVLTLRDLPNGAQGLRGMNVKVTIFFTRKARDDVAQKTHLSGGVVLCR